MRNKNRFLRSLYKIKTAFSVGQVNGGFYYHHLKIDTCVDDARAHTINMIKLIVPHNEYSALYIIHKSITCTYVDRSSTDST